jgi:hypothetical protein
MGPIAASIRKTLSSSVIPLWFILKIEIPIIPKKGKIIIFWAILTTIPSIIAARKRHQNPA